MTRSFLCCRDTSSVSCNQRPNATPGLPWGGIWMKRLFVMTLILLSGGPAYGEWVRIATDDQGMTAYVDLHTIQRKGEMVEMWALVDIETAKGDSFLSRKEQGEYDCAAERHRRLAGSWYSEHMGNGKVDAIDAHESKWNRIEPGSIPQILWKVACSK